ncbi:MAG: DUF359 domain-containing protein [Candidatus Bathyarchaeota archaeon]|nr:DUF359 domain-containing protein [Candidatus Bathyarchaeota archaeon]
MAVAYCVTPELRARLKVPFGVLIRGSFAEAMHELQSIAAKDKPPVIVGVGDTVSRNLVAFGVEAGLLVTDSLRRRRRVAPAVFSGWRVVHVRNPAGVITEEAVAAVRAALAGGERVHVVVDGEEDLLTLIAVAFAAEGSLVVYGQPGEGLVVVRVTAEKRGEALGLLKAMETGGKAK